MTESELLETIKDCNIILKSREDAKAYLDKGTAESCLAAEYIGTDKEKIYLEKAVANLTTAIELKPDSALLQEAYRERGSARSELELHADAVEDFTKAIEMTSDVHALTALYISRACSYGEIGEEELSQKDMEKYDALVLVTRG
ncbi:hypothetical protein KY333_04390 [Candidatus Woesearchaeota archaeon]|nr:hypothetical protein [Candidatus Woesearchaeota archaeon]MBW2994174.1 hypothetical protein [Candidatus Woesearchaeota archaeon]